MIKTIECVGLPDQPNIKLLLCLLYNKWKNNELLWISTHTKKCTLNNINN